MKLLFLFILFNLSFALNEDDKCSELYNLLNTTQVYSLSSVEEAFQCIESFELSNKNKTDILTLFRDAMKAYVYVDILKNPPDPNDDNYYHNKVDIDAELKKIEEKQYTNFYDFFTDVYQMLVQTGDGHTNFAVNGNALEGFNLLTYFFYITLFEFKFKGKDLYIIPNILAEEINSTESTSIMNNINRKVKTINGKEPTEFIRQFGNNFIQLKGLHSKFTEAKRTSIYGSLSIRPLPKEYLQQKILVEYEGVDEIFEYRYYIQSINPLQLSQSAQRKLNNYLKGKEKIILKVNEIIETEEDYQRKQQALKLENILPERLYEEGDDVYCFIDDEKKMNTFVVTTFLPENEDVDNYYSTVKKCIQRFYINDYPIQIILPKNNGGFLSLQQIIQKLFAPHNDIRFIHDVKISDMTETILNDEKSDGITDIYTCEPLKSTEPFGEWYTKSRNITYGNVIHTVSQLVSIGLSEEMIETIDGFSNFRKPTEIVIYTDSYCFSACSMFTKGMKEHGSAILVGFDGDPTIEGVHNFDVGQSPTSVITMDSMFNETGQDALNKLGLTIRIGFGESYRYNYFYNETIPREFIINDVDERSDLNYYGDSILDQFTENTLKVLKKYETYCNPNNKRLVLVDSSCDNIVQKIDEHAFGGYECGDDGKWSNKCVIAHCDVGYFYDYDNKKCIVDECYQQKDSNGSVTMKVIFVLMIIIVLII